MFKLFQKKRSVSVSIPSAMSFGELREVLDILKEEIYFSGEVAGIVACQAVPAMELWIRRNWGMKDNTPIPAEIQRLYNETVIDFYKQSDLSSTSSQ